MKSQVLAGAVVGLFCVSSLAAQTIDLKRVETVTDSLAAKAIAENVIPGMSVAVARNGKIVFSRAYGSADLDNKIAATTQTVFGITSVTKQFTAAMIMKLAEQGKISLDHPVAKYLPDFPREASQVTVRQLLNHTSGIFSMRSSNSVDLKDAQRDVTTAEMVELIRKQPIEFKPGEKYQYNNMAYYLASAIIAKVTGKTFGEFMQQELGALGLKQTRICDAKRTLPNQAFAYAANEGKFVPATFVSMHFMGGAAALCSTAEEVATWSQLLHSGKVVSKASLEEMTTPTVLTSGEKIGYGLGLDIDRVGTRTKIYHGGTGWWGAYLSQYPDDGVTIAVLTNAGRTGRIKAEEIEKTIARTVFGSNVLDLPLSAAEVDRYVGTYTVTVGDRTRDLRVFVEEGRLKGQAAGGGIGLLRHQGNNEFQLGESGDVKITFTMANGRAESLVILQAGRSMPGRRKE